VIGPPEGARGQGECVVLPESKRRVSKRNGSFVGGEASRGAARGRAFPRHSLPTCALARGQAAAQEVWWPPDPLPPAFSEDEPRGAAIMG